MTKKLLDLDRWKEVCPQGTCGCGFNMPNKMKTWAGEEHEVRNSRIHKGSELFRLKGVSGWEFCECLFEKENSILKDIYA